MTRILTKDTFLQINRTMTFVKAELRLFLVGKGFPANLKVKHINIVDVSDRLIINGEVIEGYNIEEFLLENVFSDKKYYDSIECTNNQLEMIENIIEKTGQTPQILTIHVQNQDESVRIGKKLAKFYVIAGDCDCVLLPDNFDSSIYSSRRSKEEPPIISPDGQTNKKFEKHVKKSEFFNGLFMTGNNSSEGAVVRRAVDSSNFTDIDRQLVNEGKLKYHITCSEHPELATKYSSIDISDSDTPKLDLRYINFHNTSNTNRREAENLLNAIATGEESGNERIAEIRRNMEQEEQNTKYILVHGQFKPNTDGNILVNPRFLPKGFKIVFADMPEDLITQNYPLTGVGIVYGNDSNITRGTVGQAHYDYVYNCKAFSEHVIKRGTFTDEYLSYIDNYITTISVKYPQGRFDIMFGNLLREAKKIKKNLQEKDGEARVDLGQLGEVTRHIISALIEKEDKESTFSQIKRSVIVKRTESIIKSGIPVFPYIPETPARNIRDNNMIEDISLQVKKTLFDLDKETREWFDLPNDKIYLIKEKNYLTIDGTDYSCIISDCGIVILKGTGTVTISGYVHTIICGSGVKVKMSNTKVNSYSDEIYLYLEGGSIYDIIPQYPEPDIYSISYYTKRDGEIISEPLTAENYQTTKSIVKNFYYSKLQEKNNFKTSDIMQIKELPERNKIRDNV
jgi:hypothetical protein